MLKAEVLFSIGNQIGESPVWEPGSQSLHWVDIRGSAVFRALVSGGKIERFETDIVVSAIGRTQGDALIAATSKGFALASFRDERVHLENLSAIHNEYTNWRLNDGACDRQGRFWAGSMYTSPNGEGRRGMLYSLDPTDGLKVHEHQGGFLIQNGLAWSPDGTTMYVSDSHPDVRTVWAFDYDTWTGMAKNRRVFWQGKDFPGRPDGAAVDADGCYWIAASDSGRIIRLTPAGKIDTEIEVPTLNPTNLCFGGPDLKTMFITSMRRDGIGGNIYVCATPYQGMPEAVFTLPA